jgi:polysaccharide export outer membrane protein
VQVSSDGNITVPVVGEVAVGGLTVPQVQKKLKELLNNDEFSSAEVIVFVEEYSTVTIMGEIKKSGAFPFKGRLTVIELIALAEGFNEAASPNEVKVIHVNPDGARSERLVRVYDIMRDTPSADEGLLLHAGDVVIVPSSTVTVIGEINKPGAYPTKGRLTVVELLALAGGFTKFGTGSEVKVIHTNPDGKKEKSIVRAHDIISRGSVDGEDLLLRSGDLVIVP